MGWKLADVADWSFHGVDHSIRGNGGPDCVNYLTFERRVVETTVACLISIFSSIWGYRNVSVPPVPKVVREDRGGKRLLLVLMCLVFGIEIGFKFSSRTVVYILNPCHVITAIQIFLLAAPPTSKWVTILFRIQMHCLYGAVLAILFPVLNTRKKPLETEMYWLQHTLMLITPFYLLRTGVGGVYTVEPSHDYSWAALTVGFMYVYHFIVLQFLGMATEVNLNNMVCPAVSDPFYGPNYRVWAILHQACLILTIGKLYTRLSLFILRALGAIVWTGEKYVTMAALRVQQICSMCRAQVLNMPTAKNEDTHQD